MSGVHVPPDEARAAGILAVLDAATRPAQSEPDANSSAR
jgi:hypothetical protein